MCTLCDIGDLLVHVGGRCLWWVQGRRTHEYTSGGSRGIDICEQKMLTGESVCSAGRLRFCPAGSAWLPRERFPDRGESSSMAGQHSDARRSCSDREHRTKGRTMHLVESLGFPTTARDGGHSIGCLPLPPELSTIVVAGACRSPVRSRAPRVCHGTNGVAFGCPVGSRTW